MHDRTLVKISERFLLLRVADAGRAAASRLANGMKGKWPVMLIRVCGKCRRLRGCPFSAVQSLGQISSTSSSAMVFLALLSFSSSCALELSAAKRSLRVSDSTPG